MNTLDLKGQIIPLVTPFTDDMSMVSEVRLSRLVRKLAELQPAGFLICGNLGEFSLIFAAERKMVLEVVLRETGNAIPIIVHATTVGTMPALDLAQHAKRHGARAVVVLPPPFGQFTDEELHHHFKVIANYSDLCVLVADAREQVSEGLTESLRQHQGIQFLRPVSEVVGSDHAVASVATPDEFAFDNIVCSPVALLEYTDFLARGEKSAKVAQAMRQHGIVRVAKAILQTRDIEVGPPRNPYQSLPFDVVKSIQTALGEG